MLEVAVQKGAFAKIIGKSPARVSQLIAEGVISGPALVGSGRLAKIVPSIAQRQLAARLDPVQQVAQGQPLASVARVPADDLFAPQPAGQAAGGTDDQTRYLKARADKAESEARRAAAEDAAAEGRWMVTADAEAAWAAELARLVQSVETWLVTGAADAVAALERPTAREVGQVLRAGFNELRARLAAAAAAPQAADEADSDDEALGEVEEVA